MPPCTLHLRHRKAQHAGIPTQLCSAPAKPEYDFAGETTFYEGAPHNGDLAINMALGTTLVWLPLTAAAVGRVAFVKYKFTDRRLSITTDAPWKSELAGASLRTWHAACGGSMAATACRPLHEPLWCSLAMMPRGLGT